MKLSILWTFTDLEIKIAKAMAPFKTFLKSCFVEIPFKEFNTHIDK